MLSYRVGKENRRQVLVFTRTRDGANRLATQLTADGINSSAIHGTNNNTFLASHCSD